MNRVKKTNKRGATSRTAVNTKSVKREKRGFLGQIPSILGIEDKAKEYFTLSFVVALLLGALSLFLGFSFLSYLYYGGENQSLLLSNSSYTPSEYASQMSGHTGISGSRWMHHLVNNGVGIGIIFIIFLLGYLAFKIFIKSGSRIARVTLFCLLSCFWLSMVLGQLPDVVTKKLFFLPGGAWGKQLSESLSIRFGAIGVGILDVLSLVLILFFFWSTFRMSYVSWVRNSQRARSIEEHEHYPDEYEAKNASTSAQEENAPMKKEESLTENVPIIDEVVPAPVFDRYEEHFTDLSQDLEGSQDFDLPYLSDSDAGKLVRTMDSNRERHEIKEALDSNVPMSVIDVRNSQDEVALTGERLVEQYGEYDPRKELSRYNPPTLDLLRKFDQEDQEIDNEEILNNKSMITQTLSSFGIGITSITATIGPSITLYEIIPAEGVHISKIKGLEDNLSLRLASLGIRIIAPIPGKGTIGLEVPNKKPQTVGMRSVIASKKFQESKALLPIALGRTITNDVFVFDLAKAPHLLVAGATGQGKSVGLNAIITSLLYKLHPSELKFVMIDPKMVEFSMYALLEKHYMAKIPSESQTIITDTNRAAQTLESLCQEMDDRYALLADAHVRNLAEYNEKFKQRKLNPNRGHRFLPFIVLIIDEYGDLIMTAGKDIELPITRIAQKARAVGIHAIIATQRPATTIITGAIKANFPTRIAFRVTNSTDSRVILDATGANRLIGRGDLLYSDNGNVLTRVQCAFVDTPDVNNVVEFISEQQSYAEAYPLPEVSAKGDHNGGTTSGAAIDFNDRDAIFEEVALKLMYEQKASISFIQQQFSIGYNRAARLMNQLEAAGIVSTSDGMKQREVLITSEEQLRTILNKN